MSESPNIELRITANSRQAMSALSSLEKAMQRVKNAVGKGLGLNKACNQIEKLSSSVSKAAQAGTAENINKIAFALDRLSKFSSMKMPDLKGFANAMKYAQQFANQTAAKSVNDTANALMKFSSAINGLSTVKEQTGWTFVEDQTKYYKTFAGALRDGAENWKEYAIPADGWVSFPIDDTIKFSYEIQHLTGNIQELLAAGEQLKSLMAGNGPFRMLNSGIGGFLESGDALSKYVREVRKLPPAMEEWKRNAIPVSGRIVQEMGMGPIQTGPISDEESQLQSFSETAREAAQAVQPIKDAMESAAGATDPLRSGLRETTSEIVETASAASKAATGLKTFIAYLRKGGNAGKHARGGIGGLMKDFLRIAKYRALRTAIKEIIDGFKTGVDNVRAYSKAIGSDFAKDMNSAGAALDTMKNAIGASVAPVLQMLIPILKTVTNAVIEAVNWLNQLFTLLRGGGTWTRAKALSDPLDEMKKSAKGAGKEVKNLLADWDELNIIQSKGGSGSGASAVELDYADMFEEVSEFDERIKNIIKWVQDHMELVQSIAVGIAGALLTWRITDGLKLDVVKLIANIVKAIRLVAGLAIAFYGVKEFIKQFKDQWENGVNWDNVVRSILYASIAAVGLGIAFGKLGLGWGLLGFGIALAVNPIKELIETGDLSKSSMLQLAVAIGLVGASIAILTKGSVLSAIRLFAGLAIAAYGVAKMFKSIKDQWENGINWDNFKETIKGAGLAVLGLAVAFGKLGLGWGLIGIGVAIAITPIKELIETGDLSKKAMLQLAIAIGAVGAGIAFLAGKGILKSVKVFAALALITYGIAAAFKELKDQLENGVNYDNFINLFKNLKIAVLGLAILFGVKGLGVGLIVSGLTEMIAPVKDFVDQLNSGKSALEALRGISDEAFAQFETGFLELGIGVSLLTGSWIPAAIAAVVDIVLWAVRNWDGIVDAFKKAWEGIGRWFYNNVTMPVGNFFIDMVNSILDSINQMIGFINMLFGTTYAMNDLIPKLQPLEESAKEADQIINGSLSEPKGNKNITGTATEEQLQVYANAAKDAAEITDNAAKQQIEASEALHEALEGINLSKYDNYEQAIKDINKQLEENVSALNASKEAAEETIDNISDSSDVIQEIAESSAIPPVQQTVPLLLTYVPQDMGTDGTFELELELDANGDDTAKELCEQIYDEIYDAIKNYHPQIRGSLPAYSFFDNVIEPMIREIGKNNGLSEDTISKISANFYENWLDALLEDNWTGDSSELLSDLEARIHEAAETVKQTASEEAAKYRNITVIPMELIPKIEVDAQAAKEVSDNIYEALESFEPEGNKGAALKFWNGTLREMVNALISTNGITGNDAQDLQMRFYKKFMDSLFDDNYEGGFDSPLNILLEEIDDVKVKNIYEEIYDHLANYEPDSGISTNDFWDGVLYPLVKSATDTKGITGDAADEIADMFYDAWIQSLFDKDYDGGFAGALSVLKEMLKSPEDWSITPPNTEPLMTGLKTDAQEMDRIGDEMLTAANKVLGAYSLVSSIGMYSFGGGTMRKRFGEDLFKPNNYTFAEGGFPTTGSMFIARESGPELVGRIGNRTAVANNDQIVSGVANGVAAGQAEQNALLRQQNDYLRRILAKESTVKVEPTAEWGRFNQRSEELRARSAGA